jgi:FkbM family methyltransferase
MSLKEQLQFLTFYAKSRTRSFFQGKYAIGTLCETDEGFFVVDPADMHVGYHVANLGRWDEEALRYLLQLVDASSRVLVVGAHIGTLLVPLARACRSVVAYEANPATFKLLTVNLKLNGIDNCTAHNLAAGEARGRIRFYANSANSGGSKRVPVVKKFAYTYDRPRKIEVPMVALDEHLDDHAFDLILMDIEGSEIFALRGMQSLLRSSNHLQVEYFPDHVDNVAGLGDDDFLRTIEPHFDELVVQRGHEPPVPREAFARRLRELRESGFAGDLVFSKRSAPERS